MTTFNDKIITKFDLTLGKNAGVKKVITQLNQVQSVVKKTEKSLKNFHKNTASFALPNNLKNIKSSKMDSVLSLSDLKQNLQNMNLSSKEMIDKIIDVASDKRERIKKQLKDVLRRQKKDAIQELERDSIGPMFTFLFGGMALRNIGLSLIRFVVPSIQTMNSKMTEGQKRVLGLKASFEFLKFSIFEAFTQTQVFRTFVDLVIKASRFISKLVTEHPQLLTIIASVGALATTLGTLAVGVGLLNQFAIMASYLGAGTVVPGAPSLLKALGGFKLALGALGLGTVLLSIDALDLEYTGNHETDKIIDKLMGIIGGGLTGLGITKMFKKGKGKGLSGFAIGASIAVIIDALDFKKADKIESPDAGGWESLLKSANWGLSGATIGLLAGPKGAIIGFTIGASIGLIVESFKWLGSSDGKDFQKKNNIFERLFLGKDGFDKFTISPEVNFDNITNSSQNTTDKIKTNFLNASSLIKTDFFNLSTGIKTDFMTATNDINTSLGTVNATLNTPLIDTTLPSLTTATETLGASLSSNIIDKWDNWTPTDKEVNFTVHRKIIETKVSRRRRSSSEGSSGESSGSSTGGSS